jgi:hypothetical protein
MRQVNPWAQLTTVFGMFIAGGFIGWGLSSWAAPGSGLAAGLSGMLLPAAFAAGLLIWAGLAARGENHLSRADARVRVSRDRGTFEP